MTGVPTIKEDTEKWRHKHTEGRWPCYDGGRDEIDVPRNTKDNQQTTGARRSKEGFSPTGFRVTKALPIPWLRTSGLLNCETINFCWFKPPSLCYLVMAALANQYTI